ncbi:hypothetical protein HPB51_015150 [Rhipicephalus microplus]|uniref:Uncharacterized protein n=1 Tax=Rhipicephalus microplus TaxID=6941 RepID=A0A9J6DNN7_RHIMP|nr:hypothetical protein HPB51_015150 [Rhipicephalus microplus]
MYLFNSLKKSCFHLMKKSFEQQVLRLKAQPGAAYAFFYEATTTLLDLTLPCHQCSALETRLSCIEVGYITTIPSSEAEQQALHEAPSTAARSVVIAIVSSTAAMGTVLHRRGAAGAKFTVGESLVLLLVLGVIAFPSDAWAQHVVGSDEARSLLSRGGDTLIRWNISPAALQHMRSESFKRQFSPWGGKRNAAAFESLLDSAGNQESHRHRLAADASYKVRRLHPVDIAVRAADLFSPWGGKRTDDKKDKDQTFNPWGGKKAGDHFGSWGGKRDTFSAWGGKRLQDSKNAFSPWGGKRAVRSPTARNDAARAKQEDGEGTKSGASHLGEERGEPGKTRRFLHGEEKGVNFRGQGIGGADMRVNVAASSPTEGSLLPAPVTHVLRIPPIWLSSPPVHLVYAEEQKGREGRREKTEGSEESREICVVSPEMGARGRHF